MNRRGISGERSCGERSGVVFVLVAAMLGPAACTLLVDTGDLHGGVTKEGTDDGGRDAVVTESGAPEAATDASTCDDAASASPECVAKEVPIDGLVLWLRADDGVETSDDGRVTEWHDDTSKVRPGYIGADAKQSDAGAQPLRITDAAGDAVLFASDDVLELPPGFDDFSAGLSVFGAVWPQLDDDGYAGTLLALGFPSQQDECGRGAELSIRDFGFDYRVENESLSVAGVLDGRGWDVISVVQSGWSAQATCTFRAPVALRRADEIKKTGAVVSLTPQLRTGTRIGQSKYFPAEFYRGKLGELLLYNRTLPDDEASRVSRYLLRRWPRR